MTQMFFLLPGIAYCDVVWAHGKVFLRQIKSLIGLLNKLNELFKVF